MTLSQQSNAFRIPSSTKIRRWINHQSAMTAAHLFPLFILVLVFRINAQRSDRCGAGRVEKNGKCEDCPAGTYREFPLSSSDNVTEFDECTACPPGRFSPTAGAMTSLACQTCLQGTYASNPGSVSCTICPTGTGSAEEATVCSRCSPGSMPKFEEPGTCEKCPPGFYNDEPTKPCKECPMLLSSDEGAASVQECRPRRPGDPYYTCPRNTFREKGAKECVECPFGTFTRDSGATSQAQCKKCPKGTYRGLRKDFGAMDHCWKCASGRETRAPGAMYCRISGKAKCPTTMFENNAGDCQRCQRGFIFVPSKRICVRCPQGTVSRGGFQLTCTKCHNGMLPEPTYRRWCSCPRATYFDGSGCTSCPPGSYMSISFHRFRECNLCERGFYQDERGAFRCKQCPFPLITSKTGMTSCENCPKGTIPHPTRGYGTVPADSCVSGKTLCPLGYERVPEQLGYRTCVPKYCSLDTPSSDYGVKCVLCDRGFELRAGTCHECFPSDTTVSRGGINGTCTTCPGELMRDENDASKCACVRGKGYIDGKCMKCPLGTYSVSDTESCQSCPAGSFSTDPPEWGWQVCAKCPPYTFSIEGSTTCTACPPGTAPNKNWGATECL